MGGVEFFYDREGLGWFALLVVKACKLGVKGRVVRVFCEGGGEEGFGLIGFLLMQEEVG